MRMSWRYAASMSELAGVPAEPVSVPLGLRHALELHGFGEATLAPAWLNSVGGLTFSIASGGPGSSIDFYAKWNPLSSGESLADEAERLRWIEGRHPAPRVVALVTNSTEEVLITEALPGESAVSEVWKDNSRIALRALGAGLRRLHELPVSECPFDWGIDARLSIADADASALCEAPPVDRLVVCQGDPCAPNTLLDRDGSFLAHVDLARLGTADRWADLAVMSMSLGWNFENYDERDFWEAYGVEPDAQRIDFYRKLWNVE